MPKTTKAKSAAASKEVSAETPKTAKPAMYRDYTTNGTFASTAGSHGDIFTTFNQRTVMMHEVMGRRIVQFGGDLNGEKWHQTCEAVEVLLPRHAPDACRDPRALARLADEQRIPGQRDLAVIVNLRFERHELLHHIWRLSTEFAFEHFARQRGLPVLAVLHVPQRAGRASLNHVHLIISRRRLINSFGDFCDDIAGQPGRALVGDLWARWLVERG